MSERVSTTTQSRCDSRRRRQEGTHPVSEHTQILESLLSHPGWRLYREHVETEWGPKGARYLSHLEGALSLVDNAEAASQARQIVSARKVIEQLVNWPGEELARLSRVEKQADPVGAAGRRGGL